MKQSKRGVTLVELIICCGIIVMVGAACTGVLLSGHGMFTGSASSANAQLDTDVVQAHLQEVIPRATNIAQLLPGEEDEISADKGVYLYFKDDVFIIRSGGKETTVRAVTDFTYELIPAGLAGSTSARPQFRYTLTLANGDSYSSGFIMTNFSYSSLFDVSSKFVENQWIKDFNGAKSVKTDHPVCFSIAIPESGSAT